jgi:sulfur carrier protein
MINLVVNGKSRALKDDVTLATYITSFGFHLKYVAVGYNGNVVMPEQYPEIILCDGDSLEIVRPVGGG